ncbi:MAG: GTPase ObgE [Holosporales bacterium]|nr:GTPase ObgE [Holosporales bacterium]
MKFLDEAKIYIKAGDGGSGALSFRREKFIEFGGPDGGAGGTGGSIYVTAVNDVNTLIDYRYKQHFKARRGENGAGQNKTGKSAADVVLKVPVGTQILADDKITEIADLTEVGKTVLLASGGQGGLGNSYFKTSTNRAPRKFQPGEPGEEKWIWIKLKLIADIGLIGLPNAGKSSFLSSVTNAKARVENYPFTTLVPQLGVVKINDKEIVIADIPGLIEDAHIGKGLGDRFLAHIERCRILVHIIDVASEDPLLSYLTVRRELSCYSQSLSQKPEIVVLNKEDLVSSDVVARCRSELLNAGVNCVFSMSITTRTGQYALLKNVALALFNCLRGN